MKNVLVRVRLFGAFRRYAEDELTLEVPAGASVGALRGRLAEALRLRCPSFADGALLEVSVLADEHRILDDRDVLGGPERQVALAVLPPVCGG